MNMEEWNKALEWAEKIWEQFTSIIKKVVDRITEIFRAFREEFMTRYQHRVSILKQHRSAQRNQYRVSILKQHKSDQRNQFYKMNYIPTVHKNLPYQRRSY